MITVDKIEDGLPISVIVPLSKHREPFFRTMVLPMIQANNPNEIIINDDEGTAPQKRNSGFLSSTQKYVFFCDDDILLPCNYLSTLHSALKGSNEFGYAYSGYHGIVLNPETHPHKENFEIKSHPFDYEKLKQANYISTMSLIRRKVFPMFDENLKRFQDWDLYLTLYEKGITGKFVDDMKFFAFYLDRGITVDGDHSEFVDIVKAKHANQPPPPPMAIDAPEELTDPESILLDSLPPPKINLAVNNFISNGHECKTLYVHPNAAWNDISLMVSETYSATQPTHIYFGLNSKDIRINKSPATKNVKNIVYQMEQLHESVPWCRDKYFDRLKQFDEVWDYDEGNVEFLKTRRILAKYKPLQYAKSLKLCTPNTKKDIDILFVGTINEKRMEILNAIEAAGLSTLVVTDVHAQSALYTYYSRAKIVLNLHYYPCAIQEQCRILPLLVNNKCVVSEPSRKNYFGNMIIEVPPAQMPRVLKHMLTTESWKEFDGVDKVFRARSAYPNV